MFFSICRYKTVSRAAEALYITQLSLSSRFKRLEKELGVHFFTERRATEKLVLPRRGKNYNLALDIKF